MGANAFASLKERPLEIASLKHVDSLAVAFVKNQAGEITFPIATSFVRKCEKYFALSLEDELNFFSPTGKAGEIFEIPVSAPGDRCERLILTCIGNESVADVRAAGSALGKKLRAKKYSVLSAVATSRIELRAHAIALSLAAYSWSEKSTTSKPEVPTFYVSDAHPSEISRANILAQAVWRARDLIHTPSNTKTPLWMATRAKALCASSDITVKVLAGKELEEFGGLVAVGGSSPKPGPRFIELNYAPKGSKNWPHVVLVGKGITFDTGGISLKRPYDTMIAMKSDMSGAAAVLCVVAAMPEIKPKVRVTALLMCAENALSGTSQRPSDVITHYGGTTVEVINTDAEGRLVLADGLAYADANLDPDYLIDIATLTSSATLGLGRQFGAMYTRNSTLANKLHEVGEKSGDRVWQMPLVDDYQPALESTIADFNHNADTVHFSGGSVTAALFLEHFAGNRNWVHLDIAGPARSESDSGENPKGGTGFGVRLLIDWIAGL